MTKAGIVGGALFAITCAVQLGAQSTKPAESSPTAEAGVEPTVKIIGCLQRAEDSGAPGDEFVLINAHAGTGTASGSSGANGQASGGITSGGTASGSSRGSHGGAARDNAGRAMPYGSSGPWFMVDGDKDELRSAAGHLVEITGSIERATDDPAAAPQATAGSAAPAAADTTAAGTPTSAHIDPSDPSDRSAASHGIGSRLHMDSMRVVNPTCAE